nr:thiamine pyrophosphate-binding protein [Acetobacter persici]
MTDTTTKKLGRDVIFDCLKAAGIDYVFGVPGANEIPLIDATTIEEYGIEYIPCLHENIALGAAMGYARMSGRPGAVIVHVTPGTANIIGNLHNSYRSRVPLIVLAGQQHSDLLIQEPLLASDLVRTAGQYTKWAHEIRNVDEIPTVMQRAIKEMLVPPFKPVFISVPWDFLIEKPTDPGPGTVTRVDYKVTGDDEGIKKAADALARAKSPVVLVGDGVGEVNAWDEVRDLAVLLGAPVYSESQASRLNYPTSLPHWQGELCTQEGVHEQLGSFDTIFLIGVNSQAQVLIFKWDKGPIIPAALRQVTLHNDPWEIGKNYFSEVGVLGDIKKTLPKIVEQITMHQAFNPTEAKSRMAELDILSRKRDSNFEVKAVACRNMKPSSTIAAYQVPMALADVQKKWEKPLTIANEDFSILSTTLKVLDYDHPDAYFCVSGGSLGFSVPASLGIALALKNKRTVVNIVGDGSTLFYTNAWWTSAKFKIPVLYLIVNNNEYKTLINGLDVIETIYDWKPNSDPWYLKLGDPKVNFTKVAETFGVKGAVVTDGAELHAAIRRGLKIVENGEAYVLDIRCDPSAPDSQPTVDMMLSNKKRGLSDEFIAMSGEMGPP